MHYGLSARCAAASVEPIKSLETLQDDISTDRSDIRSRSRFCEHPAQIPVPSPSPGGSHIHRLSSRLISRLASILFNFPNPESSTFTPILSNPTSPNHSITFTMSAVVFTTPISAGQPAKPKPSGAQNIIRTNAGAVAPVFF